MRRRVCLAAVLALAPIAAGSAQPQRFAVDFTWAGTQSCFEPQSPPFILSSVPPGTTQLRFLMQDLDAPDYPHGGGTIAYSGQSSVPRGAFSYRGPCPPRGRHRYRWTVEAFDAAGRTLATAVAVRPFPPG